MITITNPEDFAAARAANPYKIICLDHGDGTRTTWRPQEDKPQRGPVPPPPRYTNKP